MTHAMLTVNLGERSYEITIKDGLLQNAGAILSLILPAKRCIIITDSNVGPLYAKTLEDSLASVDVQHDTITVRAGEESKSFDSSERLMEELLSLKPDRKTCLIALGGGVVGDLTGFAASTLLRGVPFIQIPTSLLAMVDSSVGGKTGINSTHGKNLIGSFYQPLIVLMDTDVLKTLPERELKAGYAEVIKYGALGDAKFFDWLDEHGEDVLAVDTVKTIQAIVSCCGMKGNIVAEDEKEAGKRALLNLGHTFAHALEAELGYDGRLLHGEAVGIGMVLAAQLSRDLDLCSGDVAETLLAHLEENGLMASPLDVEGVEWDVDAICAHFEKDKKAEAGKAVFILLNAIGEAVIKKDVDPELAKSVVRASLSR